MKVNVNEFNHQIVIENFIVTENDRGFPVEEWQTYYSCRAKVNNLFGKEYWSAKAVQSENTVEFIIRYAKALKDIDTKKYRINFNNKYFNITSIDNILYQNKYIKFKAIEVS